LGQDLLDRDFTINAIALPLLAEERLIDPLRGLDDLQKDVLRMVSEKSLTDDPLRILKGIRHATVLGLDVEAETLLCMQKEVTGLYHVSPERIRQEVWKIFGSRNASGGLQLLSQSNVGNYLFGNDFLSSVDPLSKGLERLRYKLQKIAREQPVVNCWLAEEIEQGLSLRTTLLWTTLLIQLDRTLPLRLADEWLLSRKAKGHIAAIGNIDENVLEEFFAIPFRERPFLWWAFQKRIEPKLLLLVVALNDSENPSFDELVAKWIPLVNGFDRGQPEALVDGRWLRTELGLEDGPEMSRAHQLLRHAEVAGQVDNPESARRFLRHHYANID
jgi:poly(A) polymerase